MAASFGIQRDNLKQAQPMRPGTVQVEHKNRRRLARQKVEAKGG